MLWFSKLRQILLPSGDEQQEQSETNDLMQTVAADRKVVKQHISQTNTGIAQASTLSPFASRILEKAKRESLRDDDERKKITSPAELFLSSEEAKMRVEDIKSRVLEKSKMASEKFTHAAKAMPKTTFNAFMRKQKEDSSDK